jgi:Uma2 family endonuclease
MGSLARAHVGPYTWDDFIALDEDDLRELIDGELVEVEVPKELHERIVATLVFFLTSFTREHGGSTLVSGYKIRITDKRGVMPDVQLYRAGNDVAVGQQDGLVRGRPDLVVEVVSPSSRRYDRVVKLGYYAALRIPEYWIVDPEMRTLERLVLTKKGYVIAATCEGDAVFAPAGFPGLRIPLAELWSLPRAAAPAKRRSRPRR